MIKKHTVFEKEQQSRIRINRLEGEIIKAIDKDPLLTDSEVCLCMLKYMSYIHSKDILDDIKKGKQ